MSAALALVRPETAPDAAEALWSAIDGGFLALVGWDPQVRVLTFPAADPLLGIKVCVVDGCEQGRGKRNGLCPTCNERWAEAGSPEVEAFAAIPRVYGRTNDIGPCVVPGCQRPWTGSVARLCNAHQTQRRTRRLTDRPLEVFLARPDVVALASTGPCPVAACARARAGEGAYCALHRNRWQRHRTEHPGADESAWRRTEPAAVDRGQVSLRGLRPLVAAEIAYGLAERTRAGLQTPANRLRPLVDAALAQQVEHVEQVRAEGLASITAGLHKSITALVRRFALDPETERAKDEWDTAAFGRSGILRFTALTQPWLREAAKVWAADDLPKRRGDNAMRHTQNQINALALFSESLRLHRDDHGDRLGALSRADITAFCNRLAFLAAQNAISSYKRTLTCRDVRRVLDRMRIMGLTRRGQILHGLSEDVALDWSDIPDEPEDTEAGRDLPPEVMRHLCQHLEKLEEYGREIRVAVELLIDTGRRPGEICNLPFDCLDWDPDGSPVLVYDNRKNNRLGRRLPIGAATATLIAAQQQRVRTRFPHAPAGTLKLLPAALHNPHGAKAIGKILVSGRHRRWVDSIPPVQVPVTVVENGTQVTKLLAFDPARIFLYAYRHSYAQRHADAGVAVDVLRELMDHRLLGTTQQYYRIGEQRRRDAVERVTTMQFDRHGNRVWHQAKALLDSERVRRAVGEVAVPYGSCSEPSNVAAAGQDCPVRFRCVGCGHFSTDISYLPDLETYLADLRRNRERLLAAVAVDAWARTEALPSDEEIERVRRLIERIKTGLTELAAEERTQIEDAVAIVRRSRRFVVSLGLPRIRQPLPDLRPERSA